MKKISEKTLYKGKWIQLQEITYKGKNNEDLKWERIKRTNTTNTVVIISKLVPSNKYIFIKQYRAAIDKYVIGFPAGLVEGDDIGENALRELEEETGYKGEVKSMSPLLYSNPALLTDKVTLARVDIYEDLIENQIPIQKLEPEEDIQVIALHREELKDFLIKEQASGTAIGMGVWYVFYGLN
ncbi:NUDIX domain-containing protein [Clostridium autoethanogenum]|uniref:NUDIX hydrolase n=1 Tax=Clostridium autoethanogenum DSM 10061 TaxID=1341692 RepID=A0ABM5NSI4_9CLOT|nr:NUDIX hydrolase [Clostridium autoethanogenum]AGY75358.1 NUDIX hydrolase [Clostridium autoethanogenum DSM 10061]ALU35523.1 NUDIX hydrolase [Clostridium autoethanogenum DSM 10061]OVY52415.1 ADP-ribose pyrophosphatase [Clostridium autoethanogenum]